MTLVQESLLPASETAPPRPLGLICELTYRCPLHCPYCSNPMGRGGAGEELDTQQWRSVFAQAAELGIVHALLSGGEPLARTDLEQIIESARASQLYTNLITSAVGLSANKVRALKGAGLDSVQISFQADEPELADSIAGAPAHQRKLDAARDVRSLGLPLTVNVVLHRGNIDRLEQIIALAESLGASRLELANVQFYGWAHANRQRLLPTFEQVEHALAIATAAQDRLRGAMEVLYVPPDYYGTRPKPCMNGWGRRYIVVNPVGDVLPCPTAFEIPGLRFDNVREHDLAWIWNQSQAFNRFRGEAWMPQPCRTCPQRAVDFGGCRCQAALLTGDAANTDPTCEWSPHRPALRKLLGAVNSPEAMLPPLQMRCNP